MRFISTIPMYLVCFNYNTIFCIVKINFINGEHGQVFVSGIDSDKCKRAIEIINTIAVDPEPGAMYLGKVTRIMDFGAFVEIAPGKEGLVHISVLASRYFRAPNLGSSIWWA